ncbi:MAG: PaaI family thioesterase [Rhodoferax sp.]
MTPTFTPAGFDDVSSVAPLDIPDGFRPIVVGGQFIAHNGPLYGQWTGQRLLLGFRVEERHTNPLKICHGGMLATFADMLIPCASMYQNEMERRFLPTISLQIDYMGAAPLGAWIQGEADVLRTTRNMLFGQALVHADGQPALRVSGIFKLGPVIGDGRATDPLGLRSVLR